MGETMKEERLCNLYYYQNYQTGRFYYFEDREMAEYDRYLQSKKFEYKVHNVRGFRLPISQVYEMCVLESDVSQYNPISDLGVDVCLDEMEM